MNITNHERLYVLVLGDHTDRDYFQRAVTLAERLARFHNSSLIIYDLRNEKDSIAEFATNDPVLQTDLVAKLTLLDATKIIESGKQVVDLTNPHRRN